MIPKIIHYCWFGGNPIPEDAKKCIESWKKYCPDYEIKEWNESNFDVNCCDYTKEAYQAKKWAFVTDYVRLYVLNKYGGIYVDTDVELIENIDAFLCDTAFTGFEDERSAVTGIIGSVKNSEFTDYLLSYYNDIHFISPNGSLNLKTNTSTITEMLVAKYGVLLNNEFQNFKNKFVLYPKEYFCPKNHTTGNIELTEKTVCIHHFGGTWYSDEQREAAHLKKKFTKIFNHKVSIYVAQFITWCKYRGIINTLKLLLIKKGK